MARKDSICKIATISPDGDGFNKCEISFVSKSRTYLAIRNVNPHKAQMIKLKYLDV